MVGHETGQERIVRVPGLEAGGADDLVGAVQLRSDVEAARPARARDRLGPRAPPLLGRPTGSPQARPSGWEGADQPRRSARRLSFFVAWKSVRPRRVKSSRGR